MWCEAKPRLPKRGSLSLLHLPGLEAGSAYRDSLNSAVDERSYFLNVRVPDLFADLMRVTDFVPKENGLATDFAFCHFSLTFSVVLR